MTPSGPSKEWKPVAGGLSWWQLVRFVGRQERERECLFVFMHHYFC